MTKGCPNCGYVKQSKPKATGLEKRYGKVFVIRETVFGQDRVRSVERIADDQIEAQQIPCAVCQKPLRCARLTLYAGLDNARPNLAHMGCAMRALAESWASAGFAVVLHPNVNPVIILTEQAAA